MFLSNNKAFSISEASDEMIEKYPLISLYCFKGKFYISSSLLMDILNKTIKIIVEGLKKGL